jgi:hypothetical protein
MSYHTIEKLKETHISENEWKDLNERQSIKTITTEDNKTVFVIAPKGYQETIVPLFCPLCELPMTTKEDVSEYKIHKLCAKCSYKWQGKDLTKIKKEDFEEYINTRKELEKPNINLK